MSEANRTLIKVRCHLRERNIKLWLEPYYKSPDGAVVLQLAELAKEISLMLSLPYNDCLAALNDLQGIALQKLSNQKAFVESGIATLTVRRVSSDSSAQQTFQVKCNLNALGSDLQSLIAEQLKLSQAQQVKCIIAGKIIVPQLVLNCQGVRNNQHVMVIVSELDRSQANTEGGLHDRIRNIKADVETIVASKRQLFQMEDQDGNVVYMPPEENRSLLMALGFCEKARVALKRKAYDEALYLLLEADEKFSSCDSKFLESVDNYALVNLDIVWCYLLLKNVSQLPDSERRLDICENSFKRTYGANLERAKAIKGNVSAERASFVRLHLLQGVLNFHKNQPNEAWEKFDLAAQGLNELKIDESAFENLLEMGFEPYEVRLALRECSNDVERALNYIQKKRDKIKITKTANEEKKHKEHFINASLNDDKAWVNPKSVSKLVEMGFEHNLIVTALKLANNDLVAALDILQNNLEYLKQSVSTAESPDNNIVGQLTDLGFSKAACEAALSSCNNNLDKAINFLIKSINNNEDLIKIVSLVDTLKCENDADLPTSTNQLAKFELSKKVLELINKELESQKAYDRFNLDLAGNSQEYLDVSLEEEEQILIEYQNLLTH